MRLEVGQGSGGGVEWSAEEINDNVAMSSSPSSPLSPHVQGPASSLCGWTAGLWMSLWRILLKPVRNSGPGLKKPLGRADPTQPLVPDSSATGCLPEGEEAWPALLSHTEARTKRKLHLVHMAGTCGTGEHMRGR